MTSPHPAQRALGALVLAAGLLASGPAARAAVLPAGTQVSGQYDGDASQLLSLDSAYATSGAATLSDGFGDAEFLTSDFSVMVDLLSDGTLRLSDNGGGGWAGTHTLRLSFAALPLALGAVQVVDSSELLSGQLQALRIDDATVELRLADLQFSSSFGGVTLKLASVPEPASLALLAVAALAAGLARRHPGARG